MIDSLEDRLLLLRPLVIDGLKGTIFNRLLLLSEDSLKTCLAFGDLNCDDLNLASGLIADYRLSILDVEPGCVVSLTGRLLRLGPVEAQSL